MGELACYDHTKRFIIENRICSDNIYAHTLSSIMSGLSATALSCPADVVKTRMMNQATMEESKFRYRNSYDCLVKTVRIEGFRALWKGFLPTWARLGPWQFVFWVSYEKFRHVTGLTSFWWVGLIHWPQNINLDSRKISKRCRLFCRAYMKEEVWICVILSMLLCGSNFLFWPDELFL